MCVAGITSADAAGFLRGRGYDAKTMESGTNGWGRVHVTYSDAADLELGPNNCAAN